MDSILTTIKKLIGISEEDTNFDAEIVTDINSAFMFLNQMGVGPEEGFAIEDKTSIWTDFLPDAKLLKMNSVKTYVHLKVKLMFDPPSSSALIESINRQISECEWRLTQVADFTAS